MSNFAFLYLLFVGIITFLAIAFVLYVADWARRSKPPKPEWKNHTVVRRK